MAPEARRRAVARRCTAGGGQSPPRLVHVQLSELHADVARRRARHAEPSRRLRVRGCLWLHLGPQHLGGGRAAVDASFERYLAAIAA